MSRLADAVVRQLRASQPERVVDFVLERDIVAEGDAPLLRALLENLIGNAWKFTAARPSARVSFGVETRDGAAVYYVRDNGAGFDMAYAEKLPSRRSSDFTPRGSSRARALALRPCNASFTVTAAASGPTATSDPEPRFSSRSPIPVKEPSHEERPSHPLVEDNQDDEALTLRALKKHNIMNEVVIARDGAEALEYLFGTGAHAGRDLDIMPQLVLLDLNLPRVGGLDVPSRGSAQTNGPGSSRSWSSRRPRRTRTSFEATPSARTATSASRSTSSGSPTRSRCLVSSGSFFTRRRRHSDTPTETSRRFGRVERKERFLLLRRGAFAFVMDDGPSAVPCENRSS